MPMHARLPIFGIAGDIRRKKEGEKDLRLGFFGRNRETVPF